MIHLKTVLQQSYSLSKDFVELAFQNIDIKIIWKGSNLDRKGIDEKTGKTLVKIDRYFRPTELIF